MEGIQVAVEKAGLNQDIAVIRVGGYIDTTTSAELEHSLSSIIKSNCYNIIIDLGNVDYISSAGWGIFISEIKGIREKGGDLKLVRMIPDVYEVFELLEFHYILKAFDTLEEAISDFDLNTRSELDLKSSVGHENKNNNDVQVASKTEPNVLQAQAEHKAAVEPESDTLEQNICQIVIENPEAGTLQIIKTLNSPRFGNIKLGWFEMRKYLRKLELDTRKKRVAFFKQKTFS
ncbi:MAG: STAS domain-containing protein [bacterium]